MVDAIHDDSVRKIQGTVPVLAGEGKEEELPKVDTGLSTIEKSKQVKPDVTPPMNTPFLAAPANTESVAFAIASVDTSGKPVKDIVMKFIIQGQEITDKVLKGWMENLREIEEYVRQTLNSPIYQQLQEIKQKEASQVQAVASTSRSPAASQTEPVHLLATLDRAQAMERVPPTAELPNPAAPEDTSQVLVLPLTAALLAGGLVVGTEIVNASTHPLGGLVDIIDRLQPIFPQVSIQDLIPVINLMIVGPIYYHSWNEAISNMKNRGQHNHAQTVQNFAKDVIKIVTDPHFVQVTLMRQMKGAEHLSPHDQERLARLLKVVLIGVALSLLYSVEVGKLQNNQFGGIEPEELRDLLTGKLTKMPDPKHKFNLQEELTWSLIKRAQEQLAPLSLEDRTRAADMLLEYITQPRKLDAMLDPVKVFDETLTFSTFDPKDQLNVVKA